MISTFAPVLIITLNRFEHFVQCVSSLQSCLYADQTDLYLAIDYPANDRHKEGHQRILDYVPTIQGFKSVNIIKREFNYGILKNYYDALNSILEKHDRMLFSEDDNVFSPDYLNFMNQCLTVYENHENVFTVCGYNYPVEIPSSFGTISYLWSGHSAWGFGLWRNKWQKIDWRDDRAFHVLKKFLNNPLNVVRYVAIANHYLESMVTILKMKRANGDGYICLQQFIKGWYSVFPSESRVRNTGHDGSGSHCSADNQEQFTLQSLYTGTHNYRIEPTLDVDQEVARTLYAYFKKDRLVLFKEYIKLILERVKLIFN